MTKEQLVSLLQIEKICVERNVNGCDRDCEKCDLAQDADEIIAMYTQAISIISKYHEEER